MHNEVIRADKSARWGTLLLLVAMSAIGVLVIWILGRHMEAILRLAETDWAAAADQTLRVTGIVAWLGGLGFVAAGVRLWLLGRQIRLAGQFPPPGLKVIRDTPLRTGRRAMAVAWAAQVTAAACIAMGTVGMWLLYRMAAAVVR